MLNELLSGRHNLHNEMSERTGQLKSLVRRAEVGPLGKPNVRMLQDFPG